MNHRNTRLLLSLAVLSALAACGGQESKEQKPASYTMKRTPFKQLHPEYNQPYDLFKFL